MSTRRNKLSPGELPTLELIELIVRYADGSVSPDDMALLNRNLIQHPSACELFAWTFLQISVASDRARAIEAMPGNNPYATDPGTSRTLPGSSIWSSNWFRFGVPLSAVAAVLIGFCLQLLIRSGNLAQRPPSDHPLAVRSVEFVQGTVTRQLGNGGTEEVTPSSQLRPGDHLVVGSGRGLVTLSLNDGSTVSAMEDSAIVLPAEGQNQLRVNRGNRREAATT